VIVKNKNAHNRINLPSYNLCFGIYCFAAA
jgi:hypothetical protein